MTVSELFKQVMALTDNMNQQGQFDIDVNTDYKNRLIPIVNTLLCELYPLSKKRTEQTPKKEPTPSVNLFEDLIPIDDYLCGSVLVFGVCAQLLITENPTIAEYFRERYLELKAKLHLIYDCEIHTIYDCYGGDSVEE